MSEIIQSGATATASVPYMNSWRRSAQLPIDLVDKVEISDQFEEEVFFQSKLFDKYK